MQQTVNLPNIHGRVFVCVCVYVCVYVCVCVCVCAYVLSLWGMGAV